MSVFLLETDRRATSRCILTGPVLPVSYDGCDLNLCPHSWLLPSLPNPAR
jgi:hypothetical protein